MVTESEKEELRKNIERNLESTQSRIDFYKDLSKPVSPDDAIGRVSRMDAINNKSINEAALQKAEKKLVGLQLALQNLADDDFGKCVKCGKPIEFNRLLALPESRFCKTCAV